MLALGMLGLAGACALAKPNTPHTDAFLRDYYATYQSKDAVKLSEFYQVEATLVDPSFELNLKGSDQIRLLFVEALAKYDSLRFMTAHFVTPAMSWSWKARDWYLESENGAGALCFNLGYV